jgi:hypothetical protein
MSRFKLAVLVFSLAFLTLPMAASADLIHKAFYDWYDVPADGLDVDYVVVSQDVPTIATWVIDLDPAQPNTGGTVLVELIEKFFDETQHQIGSPDFLWTVIRDNLPYDIYSFHIDNYGVPTTWEWNEKGWIFTEDSAKYHWVGTPGIHEPIDGGLPPAGSGDST